MPLPLSVVSLYRAAVPPCLRALASYLAQPDARGPDGSLSPDEANVVLVRYSFGGATSISGSIIDHIRTPSQGLCTRYCLEPGAEPDQLHACLLATETLLSSSLFASDSTFLLSPVQIRSSPTVDACMTHMQMQERLSELIRDGKAIADRYKALPPVSHALSCFGRRITSLMASAPYIVSTSASTLLDQEWRVELTCLI